MNIHQEFIDKISDYLDGTLSIAEKKTFEAHLAECESCQKALNSFRQVKSTLKESTDAKLSPDARLRLYEKMNVERQKRGEKLLRIPAELAAQAKAKSAAAGQAAQQLAVTGVETAGDVAKSGVAFGETAAKGAKQVGGKMAKTAKKGAKRAKKMAATARKTVTDVTRTMGEAAEVVGDAPKSPLKAATTPPKLAGKGIKAGAQMAKGSAKIMADGVKGSIEMMAGGAETAAEAMIQAGKTTKAMVDGIDTAAEAKNKLAAAAATGAKSVAEAEPPAEPTEDSPQSEE